jgi:hypothetical protein
MYEAGNARDRVVAWAFVVALQGLVVWWLLRHGTSGLTEPYTDDALQIELIARSPMKPNARPTPSARSRGRGHDRAAVSRSMPRAQPTGERADNMPALALSALPSVPRPSMDLHPADVPLTLAPRDPLRRRVPLDAAATRFEAHWAPAGNALDQAAFRSRAAGLALHAFGGPSRHCTEIERRRRLPDCLPLTGEEEENERLRRSLDP